MWQVFAFLILILILGCVNGRETFVVESKEKPHWEKPTFPHNIPLTAEEMNKFYFGHPKPIFQVPPKSPEHPLNYFYNPKYATYKDGGYYQGLDTPAFWPQDSKGGFKGVDPKERAINIQDHPQQIRDPPIAKC